MGFAGERVKIKDVCILNPRMPEIADNEQVSFVPMQSVGEDGSIDSSEIRMASEVKKGFTYFQDDDVLFAKITPCMENGKGAVAKDLCNHIGFGSTEFHVLRPDKNVILPRWLFYFTHWNSFRKLCERNMTGSAGQKRVPKVFLENYEFNLPTIEEQTYQVSVLERIDRLISARKQELEQFNTLIKARFVELFGTYPNNEKGWKTGTIRDVVNDVRYGSSRPAVDGGKYPYLRMNNITYGGELDLSNVKQIDVPEEELPKCTVQRGDVLFNRTNSKELVGKTCVYNRDEMMVLAGFVIRVRVNELVLPEFLSAFLNTDFSKQMLLGKCKTAIGQANINAQEMQDIGLYLPPIELQQQFVNFKAQVDKSKFVREYE